MKFKTAKLIEIANAEITIRENQSRTKYEAAVAKYEAQRTEWLRSDSPTKFSEAAHHVLRRVAKSEPVTPEDIKQFSGSYYSTHPNTFSVKKPERRDFTADVETLEALRDFLASVSDDEVTSTGLRDVGFRDIATTLRKSR